MTLGLQLTATEAGVFWGWRQLIWTQTAYRNRSYNKPPSLNEPTCWACALLFLLPALSQSEPNMLNENSFFCLKKTKNPSRIFFKWWMKNRLLPPTPPVQGWTVCVWSPTTLRLQNICFRNHNSSIILLSVKISQNQKQQSACKQ